MKSAIRCALFWGAAAVSLPGAGADDSAKAIPVLVASGQEDAGTPGAPVWQRARAVEIPLQPAFPGHPYIAGMPVTERVAVQAVRMRDRLFVKLAWRDHKANTAIDGTHQFADGAAVQFPLNGKASTSSFIGDGQNPVNVWHWRADGRVENLLAKGFGTATRIPSGGLTGRAVRTDGGWELVLSRSLRAKAGEGASLRGRGSTPIAFAAWDGDNQERDGLKAVTLEWWQLRF